MRYKTLISERSMDDLDILDRLYSMNDRWADYIERFYDENYPDAEDLTAISPKDLKKLLRDIRNIATKELESGNSEISDEEFKLLDIHVTKDIAETIFRNKSRSNLDYDKGWADCYEMLRDNKFI